MKLDVGTLHEEEIKEDVWLAKEELRKCRNGFDGYFSQTERHIVYVLIVLEYTTETKTSQNSEKWILSVKAEGHSLYARVDSSVLNVNKLPIQRSQINQYVSPFKTIF